LDDGRMFMQDYSQVKEIIETLRAILKAMESCKLKDTDLEDVRQVIREVNVILYHCKQPAFMGKEQHTEGETDCQELKDSLETLIHQWEFTIHQRKGLYIDTEFWDIYEFFKYANTVSIYDAVREHFNSLLEGLRIDFLALPMRYTFLKSRLDYTKEDYSLISSYVNMMAENIEKYRWLYMRLADYRSRGILNGIIRYWFQFDINDLYRLLEREFTSYFDPDILLCNEEDVVVDVGAYIGDSIFDFIQTYGSYKKIYAYEITESTFQTLEENTRELPDIVLSRKGVSDRSGFMYIDASDHSAGNKLLENGGEKIEVVALDDDIKEPVSVIKMDIEGAEKEALMGAKRHIEEEKPKLLISAYHNPEDIFEIPELISSIRDDYKFYLRFYGRGCLWPCDYVILAV